MSHAESSPRLLDYLAHIVEAIERIRRYVQNMDEAAFAADQRTQDAVIRNFEIIGEACNNVAKQFSGRFVHYGPQRNSPAEYNEAN